MFSSLWNKVAGWKVIAGYVLLNIPFLTDHPLLQTSIKDVLAGPTNANVAALVGQAVLVIGVVDRFRKTVNGAK
jgi:hypothetical protein